MDYIQLGAERRLAWEEWGDTIGAPTLFCQGAGMAGALPFGAKFAENNGLRILSIDRPGLGGSDHDPDKSFDSWVRDIGALLSALNEDKVDVIGFSQGAPFALALGAAGLAKSVTIVSGQDELSHAALRGKLPDPVAQMVERAQSTPHALEEELTATATAEWLWSMIDAMSSPADRAVYAEEDFAAAYRAALAAGFRQGARGYARDTVLAMAPWPFAVERITCPVRLWFGLQDQSPVHSPDFGVSVAARTPHSELMQIDEEGSSILWNRADEILSALR